MSKKVGHAVTNCLFNACNIENYFGKSNLNADFNYFSNLCTNFFNSVGGRNPAGPSWSFELEKLALYMHLDKLTYLLEDSYGNIAPQISGNCPGILQNLQTQRIKDIKNHLHQNKGTTTFVHFICHLNSLSLPHVVLVSLVQDYVGVRRFYIFDNLNANITDNSEILSFLYYINANFR